MGLVLAALLGLALRWLWRERDWQATTARKALRLAVLASCLLILSLVVDHTRFVVEEVTAGRQFEGRLMGYNNLPEIRFEDVKRVLRLARERVAARLHQDGR